jgi:glycerophosphoryl diester phosphodiesterase
VGSAWTRGLATAGAIAAALAYLAASADGRTIGTPYIQAHRGGSIVDGKPAYPENTMPAFRHSAKRGFILEMDAKLTKDGVPVIMHDATLDRTTDCTGLVVDRTLAQLRRCRVDILGTEGNSVHIDPNGRRAAPIPTLAHVLDFIRKHEAKASIEIKNIPTDPDFDNTKRFATTVAKTIRASRVPQSRLIVQSFWPPDLTVAQRILPLADFSFLTTSAGNAGGATYAATHDIQWVSPQWPVDARYIADAHVRGREIVPYTIDDRRDLVRAADEGVDAIITNDPGRARRVLHHAAPKARPSRCPRRRRSAVRRRLACTRGRSRTSTRQGEPRGCSPCSSSRKPATSPPTAPSGRRSNA